MLNEILKTQINETAQNSGVYRFIGENDEILYIGKAKNLRKRLLSYTKIAQLSARIARMTFLARKIETTTTNSDLEAILLEHNLIKKFSPKFNILLKDDKSFATISIDKNHDFGAIFKYRGVKKKDFYSFGPFASGFDINRVIDVLRKSFLLRNCSDAEFSRRKKPCLEYQIKKCSGPCVDLISKQDYQKSILQAVDFLSGKSAQIQAQLAQKMQEFSDAQEYEKAGQIRDKIKSLSSIQAEQNINLSDIVDADFIVLVEEKNQYCVYVAFYRGGNNYGGKGYFFEKDDLSNEEFLSQFLGQFYQNEAPPKLIFLNLEIAEIDLMNEFLSKLGDEKIAIKIPKQGDKLRIINDYEQIAKKTLSEKIAKNLSDKKLLFEVKEVFGLKEIPKRIEVYDNSHTANQNAVGAMICAGLDGFIKSQYRKFNIKFDGASGFQSLEPQQQNRDDTAMLKEVLRRRFKNAAADLKADIAQQNVASEAQKQFENSNLDSKSNESQQNANPERGEIQTMPDLVIIDGGLPQLSAAREVFDELKLTIPLVCMAKGEFRNAGEETYYKLDKSIIEIKKNSPLAFYLQRLRDEAHRFAITTHRAKRAKTMTKSALDEISGIGGKRKKALLNHFGSTEKIKEASVEDLLRVGGINKKVATKIWESLRK